jgi:hypothetical protein
MNSKCSIRLLEDYELFFKQKLSLQENEYEWITFIRIKVIRDGDRNMFKKALN